MNEPAAEAPSRRPYLAPDAAEPVAPLAERPTFAVVTAAYQASAFIAANVEAILGGTLPPDEYIVCDDGSMDDIEGALAPFGDRVTLICQENRGPAAAYNAAVAAARSDFVVQTDHDDAFAPERLEAIAELAVIRPDLDLIVTDALMELDGEGVATYKEFNGFPIADQRTGILEGCFFGWPAIRRERLLALGGFDESLRIAFDWECWVRLILGGCAVGLVDEPLYRFRIVRGSVSSNTARNFREELIVLERLRDDDRLSPGEQRVVAERLHRLEQRATLLEAREAILEGHGDARRRALRVLAGPGQPLPVRIKAGLAFISPGYSRKVLERQIAESPTGGIDLADR